MSLKSKSLKRRYNKGFGAETVTHGGPDSILTLTFARTAPLACHAPRITT